MSNNSASGSSSSIVRRIERRRILADGGMQVKIAHSKASIEIESKSTF